MLPLTHLTVFRLFRVKEIRVATTKYCHKRDATQGKLIHSLRRIGNLICKKVITKRTIKKKDRAFNG